MIEVFCNFCGTKMNSVSIGWLCPKCKAFRDMNGNVHEHENKPFLPPQTNADHIRGMTDEELADWIDSMLNHDRDDWNVPGCYSCINFGTHHSDPENKDTHLYECSECDHEGSYENGLKYGVLSWLRKTRGEKDS